MKISVIIPTLNEAENLTQLIPLLKKDLVSFSHEILVMDAGSSDRTIEVAERHGADLATLSEKKGRACQMNEGARIATGDLLYFVHADTRPPEGFAKDIVASVKEGYESGCYQSAYDCDLWLMKFNAWLTKFDKLFLRGGDQSLFIKKSLFFELGGFREDYRIMEDFEFLKRLRDQASFRLIPKNIMISARKYDDNSYARVNIANIIVVMMYRFGASQETLVNTYKKLLNYR